MLTVSAVDTRTLDQQPKGKNCAILLASETNCTIVIYSQQSLVLEFFHEETHGDRAVPIVFASVDADGPPH